MPKYGLKAHYGYQIYGYKSFNEQWFAKSLNRIPLGLIIRGSVASKISFRARRGNGFYGSVVSALYQDKFRHTVPSSINNSESASSRALFARAVKGWFGYLSESQRDDYRRRAALSRYISGYTIWIRDVMRGVVTLPEG